MAKINFSAAIEMVSCSDPGRVRRNNEDAVYANAASGLAILADGMGGHKAGEVASSMVTAALSSELEQAFEKCPPRLLTANRQAWAREIMLDAIVRTNAAVHLAANNNPSYAGMGTTVVVVQFYDNRLVAAHVGDSRLYRLRDDVLVRLTRDHSLLQEQIDRGLITPEQARLSPHKNLVTRALGVEAVVEGEIAEYEVRPGDVYLLCSDGLSDMADDSEIAAILAAMSSNLSLCAAQLVQMANEQGGRDNVSVILAKVRGPFSAEGAR